MVCSPRQGHRRRGAELPCTPRQETPHLENPTPGNHRSCAIDGAQAEEEAGAQYERLWDAVWIRARDIIAEVIQPASCASSWEPLVPDAQILNITEWEEPHELIGRWNHYMFYGKIGGMWFEAQCYTRLTSHVRD